MDHMGKYEASLKQGRVVIVLFVVLTCVETHVSLGFYWVCVPLVS